MQKLKRRINLPLIGLYLLLMHLSPVAFSADDNRQSEEKPRSGSLILPAAADEDKSEKKCMTVCQRWGEDCMIDSRRGVRKCRRTCKEFGQECF
jgi:hypothetical protein